MKIRYVVFDDMLPVLIGPASSHVDVKLSPRFGEGKPTSAGFCAFKYDENKNEKDEHAICRGGWMVDVWGESVGLKLKPGERDAYFIEKLLDGDSL